MKRQPGLVIASYATIYVVWGSTYFFIRLAVLTNDERLFVWPRAKMRTAD